MAISVGAALGTGTATASGATVSASTTDTVASGGHIFAIAAYPGKNTDTVTFSGGGLTWQTDKLRGTSSAGELVVIGSAYCPAGLASSTSITASCSVSTYVNKAIMLRTATGLNVRGWTLTTGSAASATANSTYSDPVGFTTLRPDTMILAAACINAGTGTPTWTPGSGFTAGQSTQAGTSSSIAVFGEYRSDIPGATSVSASSSSTISSGYAFIWVEYSGRAAALSMLGMG